MDYSAISSLKVGEKFTGQWANLNIFSSSLSVEEMKNITSTGNVACEESGGDLVSWNIRKWVLSGNGGAVRELEYSERPCRRVSKMHLYHMEAQHTQAHCMEHCKKLWGRSPSVRTQKNWETIMEEVTTIAGNTSNIKTLPNIRLAAAVGNDYDKPFSKLSHWNETETLDNKTIKLEAKLGVWRDYYTGVRLDNFTKPWMPGHAKERRNFLLLNTNQPLKSSWDQCWWNYQDMGCLCEYDFKYDPVEDHPPMLSLWGVESCSLLFTSDAVAGLVYSPKQSFFSTKDMFFVGGMSTQIRYNESAKIWVLTDALSEVRAETKASKESFALGKQRWTITGDNSNCHDGVTYTKDLKLSGCHIYKHFTCDNGQCIPLEERCDTLAQCKDKSDEIGCNILLLEHGYNKRIPPITTTGSTTIPLRCDVSIVFSKVVHIDEKDHAIEFQFEILLEWKDNRVTYHNLKKDLSLNALNDTDMQRLWLPLIIYENTDDKESTRLGTDWEWKTSVLVKRIGNASFASYTDGWLDGTQIFEGRENVLQMSQTYTHKFQCVYQLSDYPFDTQVRIFSVIDKRSSRTN